MKIRQRPAASCALALTLLISLAFPFRPDVRAAAGPSEDAPRSYKPNYKVSPGAEYVPGEVLVRFRPGSEAVASGPASPAEGEDVSLVVRDAAGAELLVEVESFEGSELVDGLRLARVSAADTLRAIDGLNARPDVLYAEPNYIYYAELTPNDTRFPEMYALQRISAPSAWDITTGNASVVVGVIDTGIDINHQDLQANVWVNPGDSTVDGVDNDGNGRVDDTNGWDFYSDDRTVFDSASDDDHGTHVAGTIGARGNNALGVTGINWQASLMSIKVLGGASGSSKGSSILNGLNYAHMMKTQRGINLRVLNNSYGGAGASNSVRDAIQQLGNAGILFVAAAGNDSRDNFSFPHYPSDYSLSNVIGVASTDSPENLSNFSNFGARVVSMGAPGSSILSTFPNNSYVRSDGTSMATPHVAGAAALVVAAKPSITLEELRGVIAYSGDPLPSLANTTTTGRRLNVRKAIDSALENDTVNPSQAGNLQITSQTGRTLNLSWNAPGDDGASGTAADYDFFFVNSADGARTLLPTSFLPVAGGTLQTASVSVPLRSFSGTLELVTYDNTGRSSTASIPVNVPVNSASDPYVVTQSGAETLSTGGERLVLDGDDKYTQYPMPFTFPYFGQNQPPAITVSTNGALYFSTPPVRDSGDADDVPGEIAAMRGQKIIAGMWDDLIIDSGAGQFGFRADAGVFVVRPSSDRIIFRWQGTEFDHPTQHINFEIELRQNGTIIMRYGSGNTTLFSVVGIGGGEPEPYVIDSHTADRTRTTTRKTLTSASTITFAPRAATAQASFQFSQTGYAIAEDAGSVTINVTRTGDTTQAQSVSYATSDGTATAGSDYTATSGTLSFAAGESSKSFSVPILNDQIGEANETFNLTLSNPTNGAALGTPSTAAVTITDNDTTVQFTTNQITVTETGGPSGGAFNVELTVTRTGNLSATSTVGYSTANGSATERGDFTTALGTLTFAPFETEKRFTVLLVDDDYGNANTGGKGDAAQESFNVVLTNATFADIGPVPLVEVRINNDETSDEGNPVKDSSFDPEFFVRQHYVDFLNREPDAGGLSFWTNQITECEQRPEAERQNCREVRRINVSAAFFLSPEFQETGFYVIRARRVARGVKSDDPSTRLDYYTFNRDARQVGQGFIDGQPGSGAVLEENKRAYATQIVTSAEFIQRFPTSLSATDYVAELFNEAEVVAPGSEHQTAVNAFNNAGGGITGRVAAFRSVADSDTVRTAEFRGAFVLMQYFGYMRRNPTDPPDSNNDGYAFWLAKLNQFNGNYITAEMVKAFITAGEYKQRFGVD